MTQTDLADVVQVARLPFPAGDGGSSPAHRLQLERGTLYEANQLLAQHHYLGPVGRSRYVFVGYVDDVLATVQVWNTPTARMVDPSWLELSRWCITPLAGLNAGSQQMGWVRRWFRRHNVRTTLVSYSDPVHGHDGALYKASGWTYSPTHHGERYDATGVGYPSGHGSWSDGIRQSPKHRWLVRLGDQ